MTDPVTYETAVGFVEGGEHGRSGSRIHYLQGRRTGGRPPINYVPLCRSNTDIGNGHPLEDRGPADITCKRCRAALHKIACESRRISRHL